MTDFNSVISQATSARGKKEQVEELVQLVVFDLDNEEYAAPIEDLREIIRIPEIAPVPNAPEFIRGILNLRGTIVVVIDLEKRFHLTRKGQAAASHIIITQVKDNAFGLIVDKVSEVLRVPVSKIQPTPSLVSSKIHADYLKGVAVIEEQKQEQAPEECTQEVVDEMKKTGKKSKQGANIERQSRLIIILDLPKMLADEELLRVGSLVGEAAQKVSS